MTMRHWIALAALSCIISLPAQQDGNNNNNNNGNSEETSGNSQDEEGLRGFWQADLPGGNYLVALNRINSISIQEYLLDKALVVREVMVDSGGRGIARFYYIAPVTEATPNNPAARIVNRGKELAEGAANRAGTPLHLMAEKSYPTTSHAGMAEYRITDRRDLDALYRSLQQAWTTGQGRRFVLR